MIPLILTIPRGALLDYGRFTPWQNLKPDIDTLAESVKWVIRDDAELSYAYMQIIPCALIENSLGHYLLQKRVRSENDLISCRMTLTYGGHIEPTGENGFLDILLTTLRRELQEELDIQEVRAVSPVGLVIDRASMDSSRHVAFAFHVITDYPITPLAVEEFERIPKGETSFHPYDTVRGLTPALDPWSRILAQDYLRLIA